MDEYVLPAGSTKARSYTGLLPLIITFDQLIDTTTLNDSTFSLTYPAPTRVIGAHQLISGTASPSAVPVEGAWSFATDTQNRTVATFTPAAAFQQNTLYTAMLLGADASLTSAAIRNPAGEVMAVSYQWSFTTGVLQLTTPPPRSPIAVPSPAIPL